MRFYQLLPQLIVLGITLPPPPENHCSASGPWLLRTGKRVSGVMATFRSSCFSSFTLSHSSQPEYSSRLCYSDDTHQRQQQRLYTHGQRTEAAESETQAYRYSFCFAGRYGSHEFHSNLKVRFSLVSQTPRSSKAYDGTYKFGATYYLTPC